MRLGVQVYPTEGQQYGTKQLTLLGFVLDTVNHLVSLPATRLSKLLAAARRLSSNAGSLARWMCRRPLQRLCGLAVSCGYAISVALLRLHHL